MFPPIYRGKTDGDGKAILKVANWDKGRYLSTSADGYIEDRMRDVPRRPKVGADQAVVVNLYSKLSLQIELVLPKGFRGEVSVRHLLTGELIQGRPRQRVFSVQVPDSGRVEIPNTPLLGHVRSIEWLARYDDGTPLRCLDPSPLNRTR